MIANQENNPQMPNVGSDIFGGTSPPVEMPAPDSNEQFDAPNAMGSEIHLQVYPRTNPLARTMEYSTEANEFLRATAVLVEMSLHNPSVIGGKNSKRAVTRIWVALPSGHSSRTTKQGTDFVTVQSDINRVTASRLYKNLVNQKSLFNCAYVHGMTMKGFVPGNSWNQATDSEKSLDQLKQEKKVIESDILYVDNEGFEPMLSYDHTRTSNLDWLDYNLISNNAGIKGKGITGQPNGSPLGSHPVINRVSGYGIMKVGAELSPFYKNGGINADGIGTTGGETRNNYTTPIKNRYYFNGYVYKNGGKDSYKIEMNFMLDDSTVASPDRASYVKGFEGDLRTGVMNEFFYTGTLRIQEVKGTTAVIFRMHVESYNIFSNGNATESTKDIESLIGDNTGDLFSGSASGVEDISESVQESFSDAEEASAEAENAEAEAHNAETREDFQDDNFIVLSDEEVEVLSDDKQIEYLEQLEVFEKTQKEAS